MINKIGIENFRIFKEFTEFKLSPITVLTGTNNSGKSSLIKLLSLLKYSFTKEDRINKLNFDGGNHNLGTFNQVTTIGSNSNLLKINIDFPLEYFDEEFQLELTYANYRYGFDKEDGHLASIKIYNATRVLVWVFNNSSTNFIEDGGDLAYYSFDINYLMKTVEQKLGVKNDTLFFNYFKMVNDKPVNINKKYFIFFQIFESLFSEYCYDYDPNIYFSSSALDKWFVEILNFSSDENLVNYITGNKPGIGNEKKQLFQEIFTIYLKEISKKKDENFSKALDYFYEFRKEIEDNNISISINDKYTYEIRNQFIFSNFEKSIEKLIYSINSINHLTVNRGSQQRILSNKSANQIDEIVKNYFDTVDQNSESFISDAFKILGIKGELKVIREEGAFSRVYVENGEVKTLLADLGYGYSQIIPILLKIITIHILLESDWDNENPYSIEDIPKNDKGLTKALLEERTIAFNKIINFAKESPNVFPKDTLKQFNKLNNEKDLLEYNTIYQLLASLTFDQLVIISGHSLTFMKSIKAKVKEEENLKRFAEVIFPKKINFFSNFNLVDKLTKYPILIIEEPEANLHPNLQSKLADVLVLANKRFNIHFILETHSEYLIRKLQYLVAKKEISKEDVNIYYFNSDEYVSEKEKKVKLIQIDEFGGLSDSFGPGFYDEATSLKFDLMKLNKEQNN